MPDKEFLTVAEYASIKGISKQRVYQLLNKGLKQFVQVVNGKKVIDIKALSENEIKGLEQDFNTDLNKLKQEVEQEIKASPATELQLLKQSIDLLSEQLESKDKLIEELRRAGDEKDKHIQEQAKELTRLLNQSQELQRNNQLLLAQKTQAEAGEAPTAEIIEDTQAPTKQGFFKRLFKKN